jgi:hypothetical protein
MRQLFDIIHITYVFLINTRHKLVICELIFDSMTSVDIRALQMIVSVTCHDLYDISALLSVLLSFSVLFVKYNLWDSIDHLYILNNKQDEACDTSGVIVFLIFFLML